MMFVIFNLNNYTAGELYSLVVKREMKGGCSRLFTKNRV